MSRIYRVLMFAPAFAPFTNPEAIVNTKLALAFLEAGWQVDIVTRDLANESSYNYHSGWAQHWLPLKSATHTVTYGVDGKIMRTLDTLRSAYRMGHLVDGCRWAAHAFELAIDLWTKGPYDFILSRSGPDAAHLPAMRLAALTGTPWIANWNDPSDKKSPPPYGYGQLAKLGWAYERYLKAVARSARFHTFPSERLRSYVGAYLGPTVRNASSVIPHLAKKDLGPPDYRKSDTFTITHAGHLSVERNPALFLAAVATLKHEMQLGRNLKVRIIGIVSDLTSQLVRQLDIVENLEFTGALSYEATLKFLVTSDANIIIEAQCAEGIFLPAKMADYVQAGRPILAIAPKDGTIVDLMAEHKGGIAADCTSGDAIYSALEKLYIHWKEGTLDDKFGTSKLYKALSQETVIGMYEELFSLIGDHQRPAYAGIVDN